MNAYVPTDAWGALLAVAALPTMLVVGYLVTRLRSVALARSIAWLLVLGGVVGMERLTAAQPAGFRMLMIIGVVLYAMKVVVATEVRLAGKGALSFWQWIGFAGLWVGMRPALFAQVPRAPRPGAASFFFRGARNLLLGLAVALAARGAWVATSDWDAAQRLLLTTVLLLPGISMMLHFGAFHLLTGCWRWLGAECDAIFRAPWFSNSLAEFWGKRWNLAFSEMTTLAVYRPLRGSWGNLPALAAAFVFSGALHELAISVPVRAGFGWPLLYFALHGVGMLIESRWSALAGLIRARPPVGRLWTAAWVILPLPFLFHQPFLRGCVWPLVGIE